MRQTLAEAALVVREAYDDQRWTDVLKSSDKAVDDVYKRYKEHRKQLMTDRKVVELKTAIKAYEGVRRESPEEMEMATWSSEKMMKWGRDKLEIRARLCGLEPEAKVTKTELTAALMRRRDELISTTDAAARHGKWGMAAAGARSAGAAFRTKHENAARHDTRWDDAMRVTQMSDPKAIGRLINGRRAPTEFAEMVPAELDDDTMRPDAISDPELRRRLQQRDDWTTPAAARARDVEVDADGVIRTLEGLLDNTANFYGNLTRERASSGLAQKLLLDSMPPECRLPAATVEEMGAPMTNDEVLAALHALKNGKSADSDGVTAELLKMCAPEWAALMTMAFNAAFNVGHLSAKARYGVMTLLYKKRDPRDLVNYRPLTITSLLYKLVGTVIKRRWVRRVPALIAECQHGFVHGRLIGENILKVLDAADYADMEDDDLALYICDRDKAFDRIGHAWLVRVLCQMCGATVPLLDPGEPDDVSASTLRQYYDHDDVPDAVRWIIVLLSRHHRKASINGALTPSWEILCSVFQGCPLAPTLYAIAAEPEGRRQVVDVKVTGLRTPCGRELLAVMFADDTQNLVTMATLHGMLNNNTLWCLASGGGTQEIKQALQLRGRWRAVADGQPWSAAKTVNADATWIPEGDSARRSRVTQTGVLEHVIALGLQARRHGICSPEP